MQKRAPASAVVDLVLDVDTGVDDALALLFAARSPLVRLLAVTCVSGNTNVEQVVRNTLAVLDIAGAGGIPVAAGTARPLDALGRSLLRPGNRHGRDGIGDVGLAAPSRYPVARDAVGLLAQTIALATRPITVVALGPMTNIAELVMSDLDGRDKVATIVTAGDVNGPPTSADTNIGADIDAAGAVATSGLEVLSYPLALFGDMVLDAADLVRLANSDDRAARLAAALLRRQRRRRGEACLGDAGVVTAVAARATRAVQVPIRGRGLRTVESVDSRAIRAAFLSALEPPARP